MEKWQKTVYHFLAPTGHGGDRHQEMSPKLIWQGFKEKTTAHGIPHVDRAPGNMAASQSSTPPAGIVARPVACSERGPRPRRSGMCCCRKAALLEIRGRDPRRNILSTYTRQTDRCNGRVKWQMVKNAGVHLLIDRLINKMENNLFTKARNPHKARGQ